MILRAIARLFEHLSQRHIFTERVFISFRSFAQNIAEGNVPEIGCVTFATRYLEDLFEMQRLRGTDHVPNSVAFQFVDSVLDWRCRWSRN